MKGKQKIFLWKAYENLLGNLKESTYPKLNNDKIEDDTELDIELDNVKIYGDTFSDHEID